MTPAQTVDGGGVAGEVSGAPVRAPLTYSVPEACALLGISRQRAHRLLAATGRLSPELPAIKIGARWQVQRRAVDRLLGIDG